MKRFQLAQKVRVLAEADCLAPPPASDAQRMLAGKTGTVVRLRRADAAAWVKMDCDLPAELRLFPADDECGRCRHIILWPHECAAVCKPPNARANRTAKAAGRSGSGG